MLIKYYTALQNAESLGALLGQSFPFLIYYGVINMFKKLPSVILPEYFYFIVEIIIFPSDLQEAA